MQWISQRTVLTVSIPQQLPHGRVFIVEVMGHKVGWLTLHAGIAGGADIVLIPEIPYDIDKVCEAIQKRNKAKKDLRSWQWQKERSPRKMLLCQEGI